MSHRIQLTNNFEKLVIAVSLFISFGVILGWFFSNKEILTITNTAASMKLNTAIVFLLSSINLFIIYKNKDLKIVRKIISILIIIIGILSIISELGYTFLNIDNLLIQDIFSDEKPGLMSISTATCAIFLGIVFTTYSNKDDSLNFFQKTANTIVFTVALISIISYILLIPLENRTSIFKTMSIHTSLLYVLISSLLMIKNPYSLYNELAVGDYEGNKIFRKLTPKIVIVPIVIGNILLILLDMDLLGINFGIISFTLILIVSNMVDVSSVASKLNKNDEKRVEIEKLSIQVGVELANFKETVNKVLIIVKTNIDGKVIYVNDSFCEVSQYSKKDIYGKKYSIINSNYHSDEFFKGMWNTINSGKIWSGNIKNKKKDGSFYWLKSSIIAMENAENKIIGFMAIDTVIDEPKES